MSTSSLLWGTVALVNPGRSVLTAWCVECCTCGQGLSSSATMLRQRAVSAADLYLAYCSFGVGRRASEVFTSFRSELHGVEDHKFITFGVVQGLIRRVHEYPVCISESPLTAPRHLPSLLPADRGGVDDDDSRVLAMCDGTHTVDEICCELALSNAEVMQAIQRRPTYVVIKK
jgi:hypothetical protein